MTIVDLKPPRKVPEDVGGILRRLADRADAGELDSLVWAYQADGAYSVGLPSSLVDSLVLATMLHVTCVDRLKA